MASKKKLSPSVWHLPQGERAAGSFGTNRRCVLVPPFSLAFVQDLKIKASLQGHRVTVNDILMGAASGAVRRYCERREDPLFPAGQVAKTHFQALVPVALPKQFPPGTEFADSIANNWCFCSANLAVGEKTPLGRVKATSQEMTRLKKSRKPNVGLWMINRFVPKLPLSVGQDTGKELFGNHSMVFSNVPGPAEKLFICGEEILGVQSVFYNLIPQFLLVSYCNQVFMNLTVDPDVITDHESYVECFFEELRELSQELGGELDLGLVQPAEN